MRYLLLVIAVLFAMPAMAGERKSFDTEYTMYAGGFDVVTIEGQFKNIKSNYNLLMLAYTKGLLGKLAPWKGELETSGTYTKNGTYRPKEHSFSSWWRSKEERTVFAYNAKGQLSGMQIHEDTGNTLKDLPDKILTDGTVDMLSALGNMMDHYNRTGSCSVTIPSFDGKRRFNMKFTDKGDGEIKPGRYSIFSGKARMCNIEIVPDGGEWHEKPRGWMSIQEQSKAGDKLPKLWLAKPADDMPAIPVRFDVYTNYGNIVMHLTGVK